jgi:nucleotide-binding universal stress UspA family protein
MDDIKRILVVSRSTKYCRKAVHYGISLAKKYGAELYILHAVHNPFGLEGWNIPIASLPTLEEEYKKIQDDARADIDKMISAEKAKGMSIQVLIREGELSKEIFKVIEDERIDLLILLAHAEWRLEHFLFGRSNHDIVRRMPCSVMFVKQEPKPVSGDA